MDTTFGVACEASLEEDRCVDLDEDAFEPVAAVREHDGLRREASWCQLVSTLPTYECLSPGFLLQSGFSM